MRELKLGNNILCKLTAFVAVMLFIASIPSQSQARTLITNDQHIQCYSLDDFSGDVDLWNKYKTPLKTWVIGTDIATDAHYSICNVVKTNPVNPAMQTDGTAWNRPLIRVIYSILSFKYSADISLGECANLAAVRFCARAANGVEGKVVYGNDTGMMGNPKPQLCAFEDPRDGMDTDAGHGPYHKMTPNDTSSTFGYMAIGFVVGGFFGPMGQAIGATMGALVGKIMANWNHVVIYDLGCVDRPIAAGPPAWKNNAWEKHFLPPPTIDISTPDSTFLEPTISLTFCVEELPYSGTPPITTPVKCVYDTDTGLIRTDMKIVDRKTVTPVGPTYRDKVTVKDGREFEARISVSNPSVICIYKTKDESGSAASAMQGCVLRPGFMPLPVVKFSGSGTDGNTSVDISFKGGSEHVVIAKNECDILHQITFCARPGPANNTCVVGYSTAPTVAAQNNDGQTLIPSDPPNRYVPANTEFNNLSANREIVANVITNPTITLKLNSWHYEPPSGRPVDQNDAYFVGRDTNADGIPDSIMRPMTPEELGLCVNDAASAASGSWATYSTPGNHTYQVPDQCGMVEAQVVGAGAGGTNSSAVNPTIAVGGGGGGYASVMIPVSSSGPLYVGNNISVVVGAGGNTIYSNQFNHAGTNGGSSHFGGFAYGNGGGATGVGGNASCSTGLTCVPIYGTSASQITCNPGTHISAGGMAIDPNTGAYVGSAYGLSQCDGDQNYDSNLHYDTGMSVPARYATSNMKRTYPAGTGGCAANANCNTASGVPVWGHTALGANGMVRARCAARAADTTIPTP